jgi:CRP/FNR family transcriptional regulator
MLDLALQAPCARQLNPPQGGARQIHFCNGEVDLELADMSRQISLDAKATVFAEGARADAIWSLDSGSVLLSKLLRDGRRQVIGIAVSGDFLGLPMQSMNGSTATTLTPVVLRRFDRVRFTDLLNRTPDLMRRVFETFSQELALAQDHMLLLGRRSAEEKVAAFLLHLRDRWAPLQGLTSRIDLPMTRQDIGDYLGLTLETVSRTMTKLAQRKMIAVIPDGVRILDAERLARAASL